MLTAFNVQSYPLLQPTPTDPMLATLQHISTQLHSFSINPSFVNSTQPALSTDQLLLPFHASVSAIWINTLWFSSLVCSLASASMALMVKQWLYEASQGLSGTSREASRRRQYRLNNLIKWRVGTIILIPSVLLQIALFLFLAGLLILLWVIHETVAAVITVQVGALFVFVVVVTVLPIFRSDCCYRSPQALGLFTLARPLWNSVGRGVVISLSVIPPLLVTLGPMVTTTILDSFSRRGGWVSMASLCKEVISYFSHTIMSSKFTISTWNGPEQTAVAQDNEVRVLDHDIAAMAYTTTFATENLKDLHLLLSDLPYDQVISCFSDIQRSWSQLVGSDVSIHQSGKIVDILSGKAFYCAL